MGWKSLRYVFVSSDAPTRRTQLVAVIPAEAILGFIDDLAERRKAEGQVAHLRAVTPTIPLFYQPSTPKDWYALVNLCQKLAAADSMRAAPVGREYVRIKIGNSVVRIRVSRTIAPTEVHVHQQMYYVSYEGEYTPGAPIARGTVDHSFMGAGAPLPPTYTMVAQYLRDHPFGNDAAGFRRCLKGISDAPRTDLKTAAVAGFLAEAARNARALPINLMLLDMVEQRVSYTTGGGRERTFEIDRMFWRRHEFSVPPAHNTAGGYMPQSGAGGADVKKVKMMIDHWERRTGFAPHSAQPVLRPGMNALQKPVFAACTFDQARTALTAMARPALDKECGVVCKWVAHKFHLLAEERPPNMNLASVRFMPVNNLGKVDFSAAPPEEHGQVASIMRKIEIIKSALIDRCDGLDDLLAERQDLS